MYPSDWAYSTTCPDDFPFYHHRCDGAEGDCDASYYVDSWLSVYNDWTITPNPSTDREALRVWDSGMYVTLSISVTQKSGYFVKPTLYLAPTVKILSGTGTSTDPYILTK